MNPCLGTVSGILQATENFGLIFQKIYMPWYWEDFIYNIEDWTATNGAIYTSCEADKLFVSISTLFSVEGLMELLARAAGSIFTYIELGKICGDPTASSMQCGTILGRTISNVINYTV